MRAQAKFGFWSFAKQLDNATAGLWAFDCFQNPFIGRISNGLLKKSTTRSNFYEPMPQNPGVEPSMLPTCYSFYQSCRRDRGIGGYYMGDVETKGVYSRCMTRATGSATKAGVRFASLDNFK